MSGKGPSQDDIDNYHRLCVEFVPTIHPSVVSNMFKQCNFDFQKARCILRGMAEEAEDAGQDFFEPEGAHFGADDMDAYDEDGSEAMLPIDYLTHEYFTFGKIHEDPENPDSARPIMPEELEAIESSAPREALPKADSLCHDWLDMGFCNNEECPYLHSLYGIACKDGATCTDSRCPFVRTTISSQSLFVREEFGLEFRRPDEPASKYDKAAYEAFYKVKCPSVEELKSAFPGESFPKDFADVELCEWPEQETDDDKKVAQKIMDEDKASGELITIGEDSFEDGVVTYKGICGLWNSKLPFLEKFRARYNEMEIHARMRMFHISAAVKCKGDEGKEHLRLARIHYNRERFLGSGSDSVVLHMGNSHYASFNDTNERVLYLYGVTVAETRDLLKQLFNGPKRGQFKFFVFAMESREQYFHFVTLDDIRKYCKAKDIAVTDHGDILEFVF